MPGWEAAKTPSTPTERPRVRVGPLLGRCDGVLADSPTLLKSAQYRIKVAAQPNRLMAEPFTYLDCLPCAFDQRFGASDNFTVGSCHGYPLSVRVIIPLRQECANSGRFWLLLSRILIHFADF